MDESLHTLSIDELERHFRSDIEYGLDSEYANYLLSEHGPNKITEQKKDNLFIKWLKFVFGGTFNILLWAAAIGQLIINMIPSLKDDESELNILVSIILIIVIITSGTFQFIQELKSEKIMSSFSKFQSTKKVTIIRDGKKIEILPNLLVIGDIILLSAGDKICCDIIIIESSLDLMVDNKSLTGESQPQIRSNKCTSNEIIKTENILFFGTLLLKGKMKGIVYKTGDNTFLGKIANTTNNLKNKKEKSIFEKQIEHFVKIISWIAILIGIICILFDILNGISFRKTIIFAISIIVANIPEGLLPTVTLALTLSANKLFNKNNVLIRNLQSIETLGCINVICSDKTGTITTGKMSVSNICIFTNTQSLKTRLLINKIKTNYSYFALFRIAICCNNAYIQQSDNSINGYPTESGLLRASIPIIGGINKVNELKKKYPICHEIPFNSENKWHLTIHNDPENDNKNQYLLQIKGAPEIILNLCAYYYDNEQVDDKKLPLTQQIKENILKNIENTAKMGERVLCFAESKFNIMDNDNENKFEFNGSSFSNANWFIDNKRGGKGALTFIGFMSLIDPPRNKVKKSINLCKNAGIKVIMITGDHPITAKAIAKQVGIINDDDEKYYNDNNDTIIDIDNDNNMIITGTEIDNNYKNKIWWKNLILNNNGNGIVFARTTPFHKEMIVNKFKSYGYIVGVTGDGVNDAPALNVANVGISMGGKNGSDVARESSDIILIDDNFSNIIDCIFEGRLITENLKKSIVYTLCSKIPQLLPVILRNIFNIPLMLTMIQILLIDLGTDIWTGIAMAYEKPESNLITNKPRNILKNPLVTWKMILFSYLNIGIIQTLGCILSFQQILYDNGNGINFYNLFFLGINNNNNFGHKSLLCYHTSPLNPNSNDIICNYDKFANENLKFSHEINKNEQIILLQRAQTGYYISLVLMQIITAITCETRTESIIYKHGFFTNKYLNICLIFELIVAICVCYIPFLQELFETQPLEFICWFTITPFIIFLFIFEELRKYYIRKNQNRVNGKNNWFINMITW